MGRIRNESKIDSRTLWTLFDSGARNTYIRRQAAQGLDVKDMKVPKSAVFGGKVHQVNQICMLFAEIEGHSVDVQAGVVDDIGNDEEGRQIDILFGALAMQQWGIRLDPQNEKLDWSHYTTEFVEY